MYEWDTEKRLLTIEKHGVDFVDEIEILDREHLLLSARRGEEPRYLAIGPLNGIMIAVVFTLRGDNRRIITARKARRDERKQYEDLFARRHPQAERPD